jgi:hypothetical protein
MNPISKVALAAILLLSLTLINFTVPSAATAQRFFGYPGQPFPGSHPVPSAGWQAQQLGGLQPWWQGGRVAPYVSEAPPDYKPFQMYDTGGTRYFVR